MRPLRATASGFYQMSDRASGGRFCLMMGPADGSRLIEPLPRLARSRVRFDLPVEDASRGERVICSNCGTVNPGGAKFCTECAARLAVACPACGTTNGPAAKFCSECATPLGAAGTPGAPPSPPARDAGTRLPGSPPPAHSGSPVAERRLVSVLFADLVGFTPFAEERDAEEDAGHADPLLRAGTGRHRPIRRNGGEVHRRRGHGGLGRARPPTRTMRNGLSGRPSSWSRRCPPSGPGGLRPGPGSSPARPP